MRHRRVGGVAATTDYIPLIWDIAVRLRPEGMDLARLDQGIVRMLVDHNSGAPVGMVRTMRSEGDEYIFLADIPAETETDDEQVPRRAADYLAELDAGLRGSISIGFMITDVREPEEPPDDEWWYLDADWQLLEISDVTVPADMRAILRDAGARHPKGLGPALVALRDGGVLISDSVRDTIVTIISTREERSMMTNLTAGARSAGITSGARADDMDDDEDRMPDDDDDDDEDDTMGDGRPGDHPDDEERDQREEVAAVPRDEEPSIRVVQPQGSGRPAASPARGRSLDQEPGAPAHSRSYHRGGVDIHDLDLGNYFRAAVDPARYRSVAKRELAWMDRHMDEGLGLGGEEGVAYIPFSVLATAGPAARARAAGRQMRGVSEETYVERFRGQAELAYADIMRQPSAASRTLTQAATSAGAATSTMVDLMRSIMWLTEQDAAMEMLTVVPGLRGQWQGFYGNTKPAMSWPGEGNDLSETTPTFVRLQRLPVTMGMHWSISTAELASADAPVSAMIEAGCEAVFRTQAMRAFLSGNRNAAAFDIQANSISGLLNSGIAETTVGGGSGTVASYTRDSMVDARRRLVAAEVDPVGLGWIVSNPVAGQLEKTRVGGTESIRFVYEDGMIDSGAERLMARSSVHLGKSTGATGSEVAVHNVSVLLQRAAAVALMWGPGVAFNGLQIPGRTKFDFDLQLQANFAMLNPARATVLKTAAA